MNIWKDIAICSIGYIVGRGASGPYYRRGYSLKERIKDVLERKLDLTINGNPSTNANEWRPRPSYVPRYTYASFTHKNSDSDDDTSEDEE